MTEQQRGRPDQAEPHPEPPSPLHPHGPLWPSGIVAGPSAGFPSVPTAGPSTGFPSVPTAPGPAAGFPSVSIAAGPSAGFPSVPTAAGPSAGFPSVPSAAGPAAGFPSVPSAAGPAAGFPSVPTAAGPAAGFPSVPTAAGPSGYGSLPAGFPGLQMANPPLPVAVYDIRGNAVLTFSSHSSLLATTPIPGNRWRAATVNPPCTATNFVPLTEDNLFYHTYFGRGSGATRGWTPNPMRPFSVMTYGGMVSRWQGDSSTQSDD